MASLYNEFKQIALENCDKGADAWAEVVRARILFTDACGLGQGLLHTRNCTTFIVIM